MKFCDSDKHQIFQSDPSLMVVSLDWGSLWSSRLIDIVLELEDSIEAEEAKPKESDQGGDCNWVSWLPAL